MRCQVPQSVASYVHTSAGLLTHHRQFGQGLIAALKASMLCMHVHCVQTLLKALVENWSSEGDGEYKTIGSELFTFSAQRSNYWSEQVQRLQSQVMELQTQLDATQPIVVSRRL